MLTLICDLSPEAADLAHEYHSLRHAGEPVVLYWSAAAARSDIAAVDDLTALDAALEDERLVCVAAGAGLPHWLPVGDCHRILLLTTAANPAQLAAAEAALLAQLFAAGAEEVELLPPSAANDLSQSWHSGRRAGSMLIANR